MGVRQRISLHWLAKGDLGFFFGVVRRFAFKRRNTCGGAGGEQRKTHHFRDLVFGLLDCSMIMFLFLPFFGQKVENTIQEVSLLSLTQVHNCIRIPYFIIVWGLVLCGVFTLALQSCGLSVWLKSKSKISLILSVLGVFLFAMSLQPHAAMFTFLFLIIKTLMLIK